MIFPQDGFLAGLRKICDDNDVLLVYDEVVTGFRLALGGAQDYFGVKPDLASYGKIVGGGGPLSAVAGRADIVNLADPANRANPNYAYVNGTLHGNPVAAAAGLATLDVLAQPGVYDRLHSEAEAFQAECQKVLDRHRLPAIVTGKASWWQVLFTDKDPVSHADVMKSDNAASRRLDLETLKNGIYILPNVRRFTSVVHTSEDFEATLKVFDAACRTVA